MNICKKRTQSGSRIVCNHIRYAVGGIRSYENTHPFARELFGQDWVLIHNGAGEWTTIILNTSRPGINNISSQLGQQVRKKALCIILNELKNQSNLKAKLENDGKGNVGVRVHYDFEDIQEKIYDTCCAIAHSGANLNILVSNGAYLVAFHSGHKHLHYVLRDGRIFNQGCYDQWAGKAIF